MASLLAKDAYLQSLAKKICSHSGPEQQSRTRGNAHGRAGTEGPAKRGRGRSRCRRVEVSEDEPASKAQRRKEKRQRVKGNLTPLTGRNYRQLLERLQARQSRLDELRDQDEGKAQELEAKMKWTNLLYKAEGVKIRDDERLLQEALKRKEKRRAQRQRRWEKRTAGVVEKMQQRQDRRRQNLRRKKAARAERRLLRARKKGRILPQDLERAGLV
ncbi:PREDICTED: surfeit locus protein 6 [Colobus angolensis palliatus]|uniref:surfeit locus protein 6 n=1 Tax=Colobus angolensis palliatus TaxID=336983 RepID=UPI0005F41043|nr:PREDICTED: surfeit locus protein 6 [Colobus angolensis palliatus]